MYEKIEHSVHKFIVLTLQKYYKNLEYANFLGKKYEFIHTTTQFIADVRSLLM